MNSERGCRSYSKTFWKGMSRFSLHDYPSFSFTLPSAVQRRESSNTSLTLKTSVVLSEILSPSASWT